VDFVLLAKGVIAGFVIAAPVGPVGILVAQRTLAKGIVAGMIAGGGAAVADTIFGAIAAFSITFVATFLTQVEQWLRLGGGILLLLIGALTLIRQVRVQASPRTTVGLSLGDFASTFTLTITNPATIASLVVVFPALGAIVPEGDLPRAWTLVLGVLAGSTMWWLTLSPLTSLFRTRLNESRMQLINRISGMVIIFFGVLVLISVTRLGEDLLDLAPI